MTFEGHLVQPSAMNRDTYIGSGAQSPIQSDLGCLQAWGTHHLSGHPVPMPHYPYCRKTFSLYVQPYISSLIILHQPCLHAAVICSIISNYPDCLQFFSTSLDGEPLQPHGCGDHQAHPPFSLALCGSDHLPGKASGQDEIYRCFSQYPPPISGCRKGTFIPVTGAFCSSLCTPGH